MRLARQLLLLVVAALAAGCSLMQTAYNNADLYMRWRATSYLDVHGPQLEALENGIGRLHAWHRRNALPEYARLADEAHARVVKGLTAPDLDWAYDALIAQIRMSVRAAAEHAAPVLDQLTNEQIEHLEKRIAEDNQRFAREHLRGTPEERREKRARRNIERLEEWVGDLTPAQEKRVRQYTERAPLVEELRQRDRKRLQDELLAMVRAREAGRKLPQRAVEWDRGRDPAYLAALAAHRREFFDMLLDFDRLLTPEQRARAAARLRAYAADFRALAGAAATGS